MTVGAGVFLKIRSARGTGCKAQGLDRPHTDKIVFMIIHCIKPPDETKAGRWDWVEAAPALVSDAEPFVQPHKDASAAPKTTLVRTGSHWRVGGTSASHVADLASASCRLEIEESRR